MKPELGKFYKLKYSPVKSYFLVEVLEITKTEVKLQFHEYRGKPYHNIESKELSRFNEDDIKIELYTKLNKALL